LSADPQREVRVRLFAAAGDAIGEDELVLGSVRTAGDLVARICDGRDERVRLVLDQCSLLIDGERVQSAETVIPPGSTVDVLPPFAGG